MSSFWRRQRSWLTPVLFILPGIVLFGTVIVAASLQTVWVSLHDWDGVGPKLWVGLGNYVELLDDPQFYVSLKNNLIWLAIFMLAPPLGLALALMLNQQIRGMRVLKSLFFIPLVLASVTVGVVFGWVYDPTFGILALIFQAFGAKAPALLSDEHLVTFAVAFAALWPQVAFCTSFTTGSPPGAEQVYEDGHRAALTSLVAEIVSKEAPMFETYLARRVASLCGLSRASTKFAQLVADITEGKFPKSLENERMIVWPENENTHVLISFRESDRDHVDIPLAELASVAMQYLARGSTEEHTLGSMRRKLRLSNIKSSTRRRFVEAINLAKAHLSPEPPS